MSPQTVSPRGRQAAKSDAAISKILDAALELFSTQGFRATSVREIAEHAGLSVGNVYHHFRGKEELFQRLIDIYWERLLDPELELNRVFARGEFPDDLETMAAAIEAVVEENSSHILLIYVDVIEFRGKHIRAFYESMAARFEEAYAERLADRRAHGELSGGDPLVALMVSARWFFYFFTVEKCFGVPMHFGMSPKQAVDEFIRLLRFGLLPRPGGAAPEAPPSLPDPGSQPDPGPDAPSRRSKESSQGERP